MPKPWSSLAFLTRQIWFASGQGIGNSLYPPGEGALEAPPLPDPSLPQATGPASATTAVAGSTHRESAWGPACEGQTASSPTPTTPVPRPKPFSPLLPPSHPPALPQPPPPAQAQEATPAHRDSVLERDALQRIARADPVLHMALGDAGAQRRPHAGGAAVGAGLGAGQAQRQLGLLGLRARARARRRRRRGQGPGRAGTVFPQGQRGRGIRHGSCGGRQVGKPAKGAVPPPRRRLCFLLTGAEYGRAAGAASWRLRREAAGLSWRAPPPQRSARGSAPKPLAAGAKSGPSVGVLGPQCNPTPSLLSLVRVLP